MKERAIITTIFFATAAAITAVILPDRRHTVFLLCVLALLAYGLLEVNSQGKVLVRERSRFDCLLEEAGREEHVPEDLKRLERRLGWMTYEPSYFDFRVRPVLRDLICHRARERLGVDLEADPASGAGRIDPELLDLVAGPKAARLYGGRNIYTEDLARMITRIEAL